MHVPTMMVSPWSLRVTTTAYGLASTMEMRATLFPGTMTSPSALWIGTETPILVRSSYWDVCGGVGGGKGRAGSKGDGTSSQRKEGMGKISLW